MPASIELAFFEVPAPRSAHLVGRLKSIETFVTAAAVYSGVDVVALARGAAPSIDAAHSLLDADSDPTISSCERWPVDAVIDGPAARSREDLLRSSCVAYIRCAIRTDEVKMAHATDVLATLPGVRRVLANGSGDEIVLETISPDKRTFDATVMSTIQGQWSVVRSTRTYLTIGDMQWDRDRSLSLAPVFISCASADLPTAIALSDRVHEDTGLPCWTYPYIQIGAPSWTGSVDDAIRRAPFHVFLVSATSLASGECQREFGRVDGLVPSEDVCCLLLPGCSMTELPVRYQQRQCLSAGDLFAYPHLLAWGRQRLSAG